MIRYNHLKFWIIASFVIAGLNGGSQIASAQDYTNTEIEPSLSLDNQNSSIFPAASIDQGVIENTEPMAQVTSVSQLNDVQPSDWAFTALQSLVERYNCIAGYPNNSFRGDRAVSRYEFAAGMNACLDKINQILAVAAPSAELVTRADLDTIQRLQSEFSNELTTLRGRVDSLEARTAALEANQFSTTTKLNGLLIVGVQGRSSNRGDVNPRDGVKDSDDNGTNFNVINFSYLSLTTQLTPRSYLFTGLVAADGSTKPKLSNDFALSYEYPTDNKLTVIDLNYRWLVTDKLAVMVGTEGVNMTNAFRGPVRVESAATGPLSWLAQRNPILDIGFGHGGIAVDWQFAKRASLQALYTSYTPGKAGERSGLFDGTTTAAVQLLLTPTDSVDLSLYYVNNYASDGCLLTFVGDECLTATNAPLQTNAYGGTLSWQISPRFTVGAWGGYTTSSIPGRSGSVETTNYMVFLNFPDLFAQGNLGGIYVGQPPKITSSTLPVGNNVPDFENTGLGRAGGQPGTTTQIEAFYRFKMTDNIYITPGIIHILEPGHTPDSDPVTIGILRSTFLF
ncbi:iron uptake porin [Nostoc sp. FACHB-280]|uniref:iron uptake porin n=1 Tax=Nostoc sp. FACHB-280 TaxID=2692839 RepID=UPI00168BCF59|nr:iron uptake porin [Nostoc sp. FACHB-280]MBD2493433.1 carbohydrate porin [Nostoc sp. FACHB-280]